MITVPVLLNHDYDSPIGCVTLDETKLPTNPDYTFSLGYRLYENSHQLMEISVVPDQEYKRFLDKQAPVV